MDETSRTDSNGRDVLRVAGVHRLDPRELRLEFDGYVPLQFRTHESSPGCGYLRFGNLRTTLVEMGIEQGRQTLRSLTITSFGTLAPWPAFEVCESRAGLPILSTRFEDYEVVTFDEDFSLAVRPTEILLHWASLIRCTSYDNGQTRFLASDGALAGVRFTGLSEEDVRLFRSLRSAPAP